MYSSDLNAAFLKKEKRCLYTVSIGIFVAEIHHTLYSRLNYRLGALVARKKRNVNRTAAEVSDIAVEDSVQLGVAVQRDISCQGCESPLRSHGISSSEAAGRHSVIAN